MIRHLSVFLISFKVLVVFSVCKTGINTPENQLRVKLHMSAIAYRRPGIFFQFYILMSMITWSWLGNIKVVDVLLILRWRHNSCDSVSNHQPRDCLLSHLITRRSKKTSKLRVTGLCVGNAPGTGEFPAQMASNAEIVSIWWRHHE